MTFRMIFQFFGLVGRKPERVPYAIPVIRYDRARDHPMDWDLFPMMEKSEFLAVMEWPNTDGPGVLHSEMPLWKGRPRRSDNFRPAEVA